ncbi:choice-of-anchor P family protein [Actinophytocola sp. NPDC049390]|uniref:choice-of-anchor P family protein n=1 Tax=Actinophytocola sp. NPDC049390 TaxID=3363894 RepID=UPI0037B680BE
MGIRSALGVLGVAAVAFAAVPAGTAAALPERPAFQLPFPCGDKMYMGYGSLSDHAPALDMFRNPFDATEGNPAVAAAAGTVTLSYDDPPGAGNIIQIDHGNGWFTTSIHLADRVVEVGDQVAQGELIGHIGHTGETSNGVPHLHFEQGYDENGDGYAEWGMVDSERVVQVFDGVEYDPATSDQEIYLTSNNCGGGPGPDPEPEPEETALAYTGPESVGNGSAAELSATLTTTDDEPVADQEVEFAVGSGAGAQTCAGTTNDDGVASCTVDEVAQPLTDDATVPLTVSYAGKEGEYLESEITEELLLRYVTGRAYGLAASLNVLGVPLPVAATPDTGAVRAAGERAGEPVCVQNVNAVVLSAAALCADVSATADPFGVTATSTVGDVRIGLPGLPVLTLSGLTSTSASDCDGSTGTVDLELTVAGRPVDVGDAPNSTVDLGVAGAKLVVNEQVTTEDGLTVNAVHLTALGGVDVVLASSTSAAHHCG